MIEQQEDYVVSEADVRALEARFGVEFPPALVDFFVRYNGGSPERPLVRAEDGRPLDNIMWFIPVNGERYDWLLERFADLVAQGLFPLGDNGAGDYWFYEAETGVIRIWQHEIHHWETDVSRMPAVVRNLDVLVDQLADGKPAVRKSRGAPGDPIMGLAKRGTADEARAFLGDHAVDAKGASGLSLLEAAAMEGNLAIVQLCLEEGAELGSAGTSATIGGHLEILRLLISKGWDINSKDPDGWRAIDVVVDMDVRNFLYEHGSVRPSRDKKLW